MNSIRVTSTDVGVTILVAGDLDIGSAPSVFQAVVEASGAGELHVSVDLSEVDLIDWAGLGAIVGALWRMRTAGGELVIASPSDATKAALDASRVAEIIEIEG